MPARTRSATFNYEANRTWDRLPRGMTLHETPGVAVAPARRTTAAATDCPVPMSRTAVRSSAASAPSTVRDTLSRAATIDSPAETVKASNSNTVGN